jgi:protein gp37
MPDGSTTECYAKTVAERVAVRAYDKGFEHHYWRPHILEKPLKLETPAGIFVGSMADLFGHWVPEDEILQVLDVMKRASWHTFQTLSKYPIRLPSFNPYPKNVWVGVSLPAGHMMTPSGGSNALKTYLQHMSKIEANIRFMSIEPLWFDVAPIFAEWLRSNQKLPFEWTIIGAASNGNRVFQPKSSWVVDLLNILYREHIPVFFKGNLDWSPWQEDFPQA